MTVATPPTDDTKLLFKLLRDMKWHRYIDIRDAIAKTVAPGRAIRKYELNRFHDKSNKERRQNGLPEPTKTQSEQIEIGKRAVAQSTISSWKRQGVILQRGINDGREIKVRDGFTSWGIPYFEPPPNEKESGPVSEVQDPALKALGVPEVGPEPLRAPETPGAAPDDVFPDPSTFPSAYAPLPEPVEVPVAEPEPSPPVVDPPESEPVLVSRLEPLEVFAEAPPDANPVSPEGGVDAAATASEACELCGLTVGNADRHSQWHKEQKEADTPSEMALLNESQLKDLLSSVLIDALDKFQAGMQGHLDAQFAQLEGMMAATLRRQLRGGSQESWMGSKG